MVEEGLLPEYVKSDLPLSKFKHCLPLAFLLAASSRPCGLSGGMGSTGRQGTLLCEPAL